MAKTVLKFSRTAAGVEIRDDDLQRLAEHGRSTRGCAFKVGHSLHRHCSELLSSEARKLEFSTSRPMLDCLRRAAELHPHLQYLVACDLVPDGSADVTLQEAQS